MQQSYVNFAKIAKISVFKRNLVLQSQLSSTTSNWTSDLKKLNISIQNCPSIRIPASTQPILNSNVTPCTNLCEESAFSSLLNSANTSNRTMLDSTEVDPLREAAKNTGHHTQYEDSTRFSSDAKKRSSWYGYKYRYGYSSRHKSGFWFGFGYDWAKIRNVWWTRHHGKSVGAGIWSRLSKPTKENVWTAGLDLLVEEEEDVEQLQERRERAQVEAAAHRALGAVTQKTMNNTGMGKSAAASVGVRLGLGSGMGVHQYSRPSASIGAICGRCSDNSTSTRARYSSASTSATPAIAAAADYTPSTTTTAHNGVSEGAVDAICASGDAGAGIGAGMGRNMGMGVHSYQHRYVSSQLQHYAAHARAANRIHHDAQHLFMVELQRYLRGVAKTGTTVATTGVAAPGAGFAPISVPMPSSTSMVGRPVPPMSANESMPTSVLTSATSSPASVFASALAATPAMAEVGEAVVLGVEESAGSGTSLRAGRAVAGGVPVSLMKMTQGTDIGLVNAPIDSVAGDSVPVATENVERAVVATWLPSIEALRARVLRSIGVKLTLSNALNNASLGSSTIVASSAVSGGSGSGTSSGGGGGRASGGGHMGGSGDGRGRGSRDAWTSIMMTASRTSGGRGQQDNRAGMGTGAGNAIGNSMETNSANGAAMEKNSYRKARKSEHVEKMMWDKVKELHATDFDSESIREKKKFRDDENSGSNSQRTARRERSSSGPSTISENSPGMPHDPEKVCEISGKTIKPIREAGRGLETMSQEDFSRVTERIDAGPIVSSTSSADFEDGSGNSIAGSSTRSGGGISGGQSGSGGNRSGNTRRG